MRRKKNDALTMDKDYLAEFSIISDKQELPDPGKQTVDFEEME